MANRLSDEPDFLDSNLTSAMCSPSMLKLLFLSHPLYLQYGDKNIDLSYKVDIKVTRSTDCSKSPGSHAEDDHITVYLRTFSAGNARDRMQNLLHTKSVLCH